MLRYKAVPTLTKEIKVNYEAVINKLARTIEIFGSKFPELKTLGKAIENIPLPGNVPNSYVSRLIAIYEITKEHASGSYVIRHINHKLSKDMDYLFHGSVGIDVEKLYLELAN